MSDRIALMIEGRIEQLGTPDELYRTPATLAVARFIGSPTINLLPAEVSPEGRLQVAGIETGLVTEPGPATLGIRAEDIHLAPEGIPARLIRTETHGADRYLTCQLATGDGQTIVLRQGASDPRPAHPQDKVHLRFAEGSAHVFGPDGRRRNHSHHRMVAA